MCAKLFSRVQLHRILWTVGLQAPLSKRFSRQDYWSAEGHSGAIPRKSKVGGVSSQGNPRSTGNLLARGNIWTLLGRSSNNSVTQFSKLVVNPERNDFKEQNLMVIAGGFQMLWECPFVG